MIIVLGRCRVQRREIEALVNNDQTNLYVQEALDGRCSNKKGLRCT